MCGEMSACGLETRKNEEENEEYIMVSNIEPMSTVDYVRAYALSLYLGSSGTKYEVITGGNHSINLYRFQPA